MKQLFNRLLHYLKGVHSSGAAESAKRFYGGIGWLCVLVYVPIFDRDLIGELMIVSASLIGLETAKSLLSDLISGIKKKK